MDLSMIKARVEEASTISQKGKVRIQAVLQIHILGWK
jgi:hypothetical protein